MATQTLAGSATAADADFGYLMQMMTGFWVSQSICTAAKIGVADAMIDGPQSIASLAVTLKAQEDNLYRLLRLLASLGIFQEVEEKVFSLTSRGELLRSDTSNSIRPIAIMLAAENYTAWSHLEQAVLHGESPFQKAFGMDAYAYFDQNHAAANRFNEAMTAIVRGDNQAILDAYDFKKFNNIVDVGGGHGLLLTSILKQVPQASGTLFDLETVTSQALPLLEEAGIANRCTVQSGNFFEAVPAGGDAYLLSRVIHGFDDERCLLILKRIYQASPEPGTLLLMESIVEPGNEPSTVRSKVMDVNMMVFAPGGRDRTRQEYAQLLAKANFELVKVIPTASGISVIEAVKK